MSTPVSRQKEKKVCVEEEDDIPPPPPPEESGDVLENIREDDYEDDDYGDEELPPPPKKGKKIPTFRQKMEAVIREEKKEEEIREAEALEALTFNDMRHQFPILDEQVKGGILMVRRFHNYLRRVAQAQEKFAAELAKAPFGEDEFTKNETVANAKDDMTLHYDSVICLQSLTHEWGRRLKGFAAKITDSVLPNLLLYCKQAEGKRQMLVKEEQRLTSEAAGYAKEIESRRMECLKAWNELIALKKARDKKARRAQEKQEKQEEKKEKKRRRTT